MGAKKEKDPKQIERDMRERVEKALEKIAYDIAFDIEAAYESAIDAFYNDYPKKGVEPKYYNRNYFTYTGSNAYDDIHTNFNFFKEKRVKKRGHNIIGFQAGIRVSSDFVDGSYKDPTDYVFNRTFVEGIHGTKRVKVMSPTPKKLMDDSFEGIRENLDSYMKNIWKYL